MPTASARSRIEVAANPFSLNIAAAFFRISPFLEAFCRCAFAIVSKIANHVLLKNMSYINIGCYDGQKPFFQVAKIHVGLRRLMAQSVVNS